MKKYLFLFSLFTMLALAGQAMAYSVSLTPAAQTVLGLGNSATVSVDVSLNNETLYGFDMALAFNPNILGFASYASPLSSYVGGFTYEPLLDPTTVLFNGYDLTATPQTGNITLASITFTSLDFGSSPLNLTGFLDLGNLDASGNFVLNSVSAFGSVGSAPVPEPGTFLLLGAGLAGLMGYRKKFRKA